MILSAEEDGTFLNVDSFRKSISISEDDTKHNDKIIEILLSAQEQVLTELKPFVVPSDIFKNLASCFIPSLNRTKAVCGTK